MPPNLSDDQVAELARQQATLDLTDEQVALQARQQATQDALAQGPPPSQPAAPESGGNFLSQYVKPAVLPTGMGIAGSALGTGLGTPFGLSIPGGVIGGGLGSGLGEAANQALGITEPSLGNIVSATAVPMAIGAGVEAVRPFMPFMNVGKAAMTLNALAPEEAAARVAQLAPKIPASTLFKQATASQVKIPMNRAAHTIDGMLDDLTNVSTGVQRANSQVINYLKGLKNLLTTTEQGLTPLALQRELEGAGNVIKSVNTKGGTGSGAIKKVFEAMVKDLDDAVKMANPAQPAAQTLQAARNAFKRESVMREIGDSIEGATKMLRGQGEHVQFNANAVLKDISKNRFYTEALTPAERGEVEGLLKLLNKIPALRPGAGQQAGSMRVNEMLRSSAIGGGAGALYGGGVGAAAGAAAGAAVPVVAEFGKNVATAMQMQTGRALMKELLTQSKGIATPQVASIIAAYAHAVQAGQVND